MKNNIIIHIDEDLKDLVPDYLENIKTQVKQMQEDLDHNLYQSIQKKAHKLKGSGKSFGFDFITECGAKIELAAKTLESDIIRLQLVACIDYLQTVNIVYVPEDELD